MVGSARSASQIMIQWQPPAEDHRNGKVIGYIVRYRLNGYGDGSPWSYRNITVEVHQFSCFMAKSYGPEDSLAQIKVCFSFLSFLSERRIREII